MGIMWKQKMPVDANLYTGLVHLFPLQYLWNQKLDQTIEYVWEKNFFLILSTVYVERLPGITHPI